MPMTERDNFSRFGLGIVGTGTTMTQDFLETYIRPTNLTLKVKPGHPVWEKLNKYQKDAVRNAQVDGYIKFDITLTYILLRNVCTNLGDPSKSDLPAPSGGWDKNPQRCDIAPSDDLERIRMLRNTIYGHASQALMSESIYKKHWQELKEIACRMGKLLNKDYERQLRELEVYRLTDAQVKNLLKNIHDQKEATDELERMIKKLDSTQRNDRTRSVDHGRQIDGHSRQIGDLGRQIELLYTRDQNHDRAFDDHARQIDDHARQIDDHGRQIDDHGRNIDNHSRQIMEHERQLDDHSRQTNDHSRQMDDHSRRIDDHERRIDNHGRQIDDQQRQMDEHGRQLHDIRQIMHTTQNASTIILTDEELKLKLCNINDLETKLIPVAPLQDAYKLSVELLYASVVITEDLKYTARRVDRKPQEEKVIKVPDDIFTIGDSPAKCVYLIGDAARGKTTYCLWLISHWCRVQQRSTSEVPQNEWEGYLSRFDLVFYLPLRRVDPSRVSVADMICKDILHQHPSLHASVRLKLQDINNRCLIFIDGLDEWNPDKNALKQLKVKALPNFDNISNCVLFFSMRTWLFFDLVEEIRDNDRVLEIKGLDEEGIKTVTKNVLVHHYRLEAYTDEHKRKYDEFIVNLGNEALRSFLQIPLLAVVCIQVWYNGIQVGNSMTRFYTAMVNMLIERAHRSRDAIKMLGLETFGESNIEVPNILSEYDYVEKSLSVLFKLGKVAYEGLLSNNMKLVFQKEMLEREIGEKELRFAFDVGLISKEEALSIETQNVRVRFFHQSVQEFLAVLNIVTMKEVSESFRNKLSNVKRILEMSNVIRFICGMSPTLGGIISQKVVNVTDDDKEISQFRKTAEYNRTVEELYKLQIGWYREIQCEHVITKSTVNFHVTDICLFGNSDTETVSITRDFLCHHHHDIRSLWLYRVNTSGERGITSTEVNAFLAKAESLIMLKSSCGHIWSLTNGPLQLKFLFLIYDTIELSCGECDTGTGSLPISNLPSLHTLDLEQVPLLDRKLCVTPSMVNIENIELHRIDMSSSGWQEFVRSLEQIKHRFFVKIFDSNTDKQLLTEIRNSHHFEVTRMTVNGRGRYEIGFIRKWPLAEYPV